jgi:serine/threonine protein kinase
MNWKTLCMNCMQNDTGDPICPACGSPFDLPPKNTLQLAPRTMLHDQYLIGRALGHGGFGVTYLAWDIGLETRLAVKEYLPHGVVGRGAGETKVSAYSQQTQQEFEWGLDRFLEEARTLKKFSTFPGIVAVDTIFRDNGTAYLVMEFLDGWTLDEFLKRRGGKITFETALRIMLPVIDALSAIHADGVLHRDISPDNIYLTRDGKVKLIDFGAARNALGQKSRNLSIILKEGYAPEEQYRASGVQGPWTDVYATAATMYHCVTGKAPQPSLDRLADDKVQRPSEMGIDIDSAAERAIMVGMSLRPGDRFQSMEDFKAVLTGSATVTAMMRAYVPAKEAAGVVPAVIPVVNPDAPWLQSPDEAPTVAMSAARFAQPPSPPPSFSPPPAPPAGFAPPPSPPPSFAPPSPPAVGPPSFAPPPGFAPPPAPAPIPTQASARKQRWLIRVAIVAVALIAAGLVLARHRVFPRLFPTTPAPIVAATDPNAPATPPAPDPNAATPPATDPNAATPPDPNAPPNPDPNQPDPNNPQNQPDATPPAPAQPAPDAAPAGPDYDTVVGQALNAGDFTETQTQLLAVIKQFPKKPRAYAELGELELYSLNDVASAAQHDQAAIARGGEAVFHVRHDHSGETFSAVCTGKLYVSKTRVRYVPVSGPHGFSVKKDEIKEVKKNKMSGGFGFGKSDVRAFHILLPTQNYNLAGSSQSIDAERDLILSTIGEH